MHIVFFVHSLVSDWNHGNAHFLRGVMSALQRQGHTTLALEPENSWSRNNLVRDHGAEPLHRFRKRFSHLPWETYPSESLDLDRTLHDADLVIAHVWNAPALIARLSRHRRSGRGSYTLLFHDTHHRAATATSEMDRYVLDDFDGVLCFGSVVRDIYRRRGWADRAFTWHEAADITVFRPMPDVDPDGDLVFIGNWCDDERSNDLREFLHHPVRSLALQALVHGVGFPAAMIAEMTQAGIRFGGWLANAEVPKVFARHRLTVHIPRRPFAEMLPGVPTIRVFEALACGIPLICAPWQDSEGLFRPGDDFLVVRDGAEMAATIRRLLADADLAQSLVASGLARIRARHTCDHRASELLAIARRIRGDAADAAAA